MEIILAYYLDLPSLEDNLLVWNVADGPFETEERAIQVAQEKYGADVEGKVSLLAFTPTNTIEAKQNLVEYLEGKLECLKEKIQNLYNSSQERV